MRAREIYRRLAQRHQVTLITGLFPGAQREEEIDGIHFVRVGSDRSYARSRLAYCHAAIDQLKRMSWDVWINEFSAFAPLRVPGSMRRGGVLFFQHFMGRHALYKRPLVGLPAWLAERRVLGAYPRILTVSPSGAMLRTVCVLGRELVDATRCNRGGTRAAAWIAIKRSAMRLIVQDVAQCLAQMAA